MENVKNKSVCLKITNYRVKIGIRRTSSEEMPAIYRAEYEPLVDLGFGKMRSSEDGFGYLRCFLNSLGGVCKDIVSSSYEVEMEVDEEVFFCKSIKFD